MKLTFCIVNDFTQFELYLLEKGLPPVDVMFLYQIIEWIGDVADRAQRVGNRLELLMAR